ncbi:cytochrome c [Paenibacillus athensensis]|uniref:Cytochrome C n=1 Tax=Paenibacillus athensensis TaxID=1967502 RepID=A0A4Y8Q111_9BACL|nr:cytochrome c [Paenibacillus athensensis]MCD1261236.1 cytochrome c [Paenibacillus athensensis]
MKKWIMLALFCSACVLGLGVLFDKAASHTADEQKAAKASQMPEVTLDAAAAEAIYKKSCLACHGAELQGGAGPNLQQIGGKLTPEQIYKQIQNGGGMMPAFKTQLKNEEVANLAQWLAGKK